MERLGLLKKQMSVQNKTPLSSLSMHKNSHTISKPKPPQIRIIHIFAPEIIKTDAANFRELVQRLTGKPTDDDKNPNCNKKKKPRITSTQKTEPRSLFSPSMNKKTEPRSLFSPSMSKKTEPRSLLSHAETGEECTERIKEEEEIWKCANSGGGFLGGFADVNQFDGFMQELNNFPFLENNMQIDTYGESQIIAN